MKTWKNNPKKLLRIHNQQFFSLPAWLPKRPIFGRNMNLIGSPCLLSTISLTETVEWKQNPKGVDETHQEGHCKKSTVYVSFLFSLFAIC